MQNLYNNIKHSDTVYLYLYKYPDYSPPIYLRQYFTIRG